MKVIQGQPIRLRVKLTANDNAQFPRAILLDPTGTPIAGSPANLVSRGNGFYGLDTVLMPAVAQVDALYTIFTDAGHTTESLVYGETSDVFELDQIKVIASRLNIQLGCDDQPDQVPVQFVSTSDGRFQLSFLDDNLNALDTSLAVAVIVRIVKQDLTVLTLALGTGLSAINPLQGTYLGSIAAADMVTLPLGNVDVQVEVQMGGVKYVEQARGAFVLDPSIV